MQKKRLRWARGVGRPPCLVQADRSRCGSRGPSRYRRTAQAGREAGKKQTLSALFRLPEGPLEPCAPIVLATLGQIANRRFGLFLAPLDTTAMSSVSPFQPPHPRPGAGKVVSQPLFAGPSRRPSVDGPLFDDCRVRVCGDGGRHGAYRKAIFALCEMIGSACRRMGAPTNMLRKDAKGDAGD